MKIIIFLLCLLYFSHTQAQTYAHPLCGYNTQGRNIKVPTPEALYIDSLLHHGGIPIKVITGFSDTTYRKSHPLCGYNLQGRNIKSPQPEMLYKDSLLHNGGIPIFLH